MNISDDLSHAEILSLCPELREQPGAIILILGHAQPHETMAFTAVLPVHIAPQHRTSVMLLPRYKFTEFWRN